MLVPPLCEALKRGPDQLPAHLGRDRVEDAAALARAGGYTRLALPRSLRGLIGLAVIARSYRDSTVLTRPPVWLQRIALDPFAALGERRGMRPGQFEEALG